LLINIKINEKGTEHNKQGLNCKTYNHKKQF